MERSDRLSLTYVMAAQAQKHVSVNETTRALDALVHMSVLSMSVTDQPGSPTAGEGYILPAGRTGTNWDAIAADSVVVFQDNAWMAYPPQQGMTVYVADVPGHVVWDGSAWQAAGGGVASGTAQFGVNTSPDTTNRLSVKSDAILHSHDDVTPGSGDVRHVLNKAAEANTASHLFQTGYSARAEFGLTGTDDFVIKVSPDGSTYYDAIVIDRTTGAVSFPNTPDLTTTPPAPSFVPTDISGLTGWWDPDDGESVTLDTGVSSLADKTANGYDAVQASGSSQPDLTATAINDRAALSFTGAQYLSADGAAAAMSGDDKPFTLNAVFQSASGTGTEIILSTGNTSDNGKTHWFGIQLTGALRFQKRSSSNYDVNMSSGDTQPHILSIVHDGVTTSVWMDGLRIIDSYPQDAGDVTVDRFTIGAWGRSGTPNQYFTGLIGEILLYDRELNTTEVQQVQRYLGDRWLNLPAAADIFLAMGQSNMAGRGDEAFSPDVPVGVGYDYKPSGFIEHLRDPASGYNTSTGADTGSCLPAFANSWYAETGRAAIFVPRARGSSALMVEADTDSDNWDKTGGTLYTNIVTASNEVLALLNDGTIMPINSVCALWCQGEREGAAHAVGTPDVDQAGYESALNTLIDNLDADLTSGLDRFFIFELGARGDAAQESSWALMRAAQGNVAAGRTDTALIYTEAKNFPALGWMSDLLHYSQDGYNDMGTDGAVAAAALVPSPS